MALIDRFDSRFEVSEAGCWLWIGSIDKEGYGRIWVDGRYQRAHRVAYELHVDQIPAGLDIDHLCRVRHCVNPDHLEPVTRQINGRRGVGIQAINAQKTHCIHGHPFEGANLVMRTRRGRPARRSCRECERRNYRAFLDRREAS